MKSKLRRVRWHLRGALVILIALLAIGTISWSGSSSEYKTTYNAEPTENVTVVSGQNPGILFAIAPNGSTIYFNSTYDSYFDVDPHPSERETIVYSAIFRKNLNRSICDNPCVKNVIEKVNISTGEHQVLYMEYDQRPRGAEWHDVDRVSKNRYLVADMADNQVFIVNADKGIVEWIWRAQGHYDITTGGKFPEDWTHLNDVELVEFGTKRYVMVSMRNHDEVIFVDLAGSVNQTITLGQDENYEILREQHNPDFIPEAAGGPAILVADSQNNRVVEYQWKNGSWQRAWMWRDRGMNWPRDADRLPSHHTLIVDSNGDRVLEVNASGDIIWSIEVNSPYDAERLGTGDESYQGLSASAILAETGERLRSRGGQISGDPSKDRPVHVWVWSQIRRRLPTKLANSILFVLPPWVTIETMIGILSIFGTVGMWTVGELWLSGFKLRWPVKRA